MPNPYPVYVEGYSDYGKGYGYPQSDQPDVTIVNPPQQAPQVIINQNFIPENATPVMRDYREDSSAVLISTKRRAASRWILGRMKIQVFI